MMAKTHVNFALTLTTIPILIEPTLMSSLSPIEIAIIGSGIILGSLLPDIDEPHSTISRSSIFTLLFSWMLILSGNKHRGFTHQIIFPLIFLLPTMLLWSYTPALVKYFFISLSFGIFAHQLGDMMVGGGIHKGGIYNYFYPVYTNNKTTKFLPKFMRCKINGIKEHLYLVIFMCINLYGIYDIFSTLIQN